MTPLEELGRLLRPAGGGIHTVTTGRAQQEALQQRLYRASSPGEVDARWRDALARASRARALLIGVPSDCGAGFARGAAFGPQVLREALLEARPDWAGLAEDLGIVDVGDVFVVPQLLHDEMLSEAQKEDCRRALYPALAPAESATLPVSPLSIAERALDLLLTMNPSARLLLLGGDHSVAWPAIAALGRHVREPWAIVHPDAHTDLMPARLGVKYCFSTWAYHANEVLGRGGRLVQIGIRAASRPREHWESTLGVRQFWAEEIARRGEDAIIEEVIAHLRAIGAERVYVSNDIDATDASLAPATGTPEGGGLSVGFVRHLIERIGGAVPLVGGDIVEVAPTLGPPDAAKRTAQVAVCYMLDTLASALGDRALRIEAGSAAESELA